MTRVKKGITNHQKHKKYLKLGKGVYGRGNRCYRICRRIYEHGMQYQNTGRKINKRRYNRLFISIINAACRKFNFSYSKFIFLFKNHQISKILDRKTLSLIAQHQPQEFEHIINKIHITQINKN